MPANEREAVSAGEVTRTGTATADCRSGRRGGVSAPRSSLSHSAHWNSERPRRRRYRWAPRAIANRLGCGVPFRCEALDTPWENPFRAPSMRCEQIPSTEAGAVALPIGADSRSSSTMASVETTAPALRRSRGQQRPLLRTPQLDRSVGSPHLEWAKNAEVHRDTCPCRGRR
jgi:hypothetical protein